MTLSCFLTHSHSLARAAAIDQGCSFGRKIAPALRYPTLAGFLCRLAPAARPMTLSCFLTHSHSLARAAAIDQGCSFGRKIAPALRYPTLAGFLCRLAPAGASASRTTQAQLV